MPSWSRSDLDAYENRNRNRLPDPKPRQRPTPLESDCKREAQGSKRPHVRFTLHRVQLLDVDAKYASVKDLLDGLTTAGLIAGDKEGQITLQVEQERVGHYKGEQTIIEIEYDECSE